MTKKSSKSLKQKRADRRAEDTQVSATETVLRSKKH
jgi:hypothetical protein